MSVQLKHEVGLFLCFVGFLSPLPAVDLAFFPALHSGLASDPREPSLFSFCW